MQGIDTTLVPIPLSSSNSRAFKAIETSDPVAINITRRFFDASSKIYAPFDTKFANWCFCLTVGDFASTTPKLMAYSSLIKLFPNIQQFQLYQQV